MTTLLDWTRRDFVLGALTSTTVGGLTNLASVGAAQAQTPMKGGTLKVSISVRPTTMNPLKAVGSMDYLLSELLYSGLTKVDTSLNAIPEIAESWSSNSDATEFTFKLRQGIKFNDGSELTSDDVVATMTAILDPATASPALTGVGPITHVTAADKYTVVFALSRSYIDLPVTLANPNARIVPAAVIRKDIKLLDTKDYGSGPFRLVEYDPGRIMRVKRYDQYLDGQRPYVDGIDLTLYPDPVAEVGALANKQTDIMLTVNPPDYKRIASTAGITGIRRPTGAFLNLVLRMDQKPFDDVRVRQALALTLDRDSLVDLVLEGFGRPAYDSFISPEYRFYQDTGAIAPDIQKAKALLAQAGYPNGVQITLYAASNPPQRTQLGVAIQEMARPAGFNISVQTVPMDNYIATIWRKANFYVGNWQMQPTQDGQYNKLLTTHAGLADSAWNNSKFDSLVMDGEKKGSDAERGQIYGGAQKLMAADVPYIVPFFGDALSAHRSYVSGYIVHPLVQPNFLENVWLTGDAPKRG